MRGCDEDDVGVCWGGSGGCSVAVSLWGFDAGDGDRLIWGPTTLADPGLTGAVSPTPADVVVGTGIFFVALLLLVKKTSGNRVSFIVRALWLPPGGGVEGTTSNNGGVPPGTLLPLVAAVVSPALGNAMTSITEAQTRFNPCSTLNAWSGVGTNGGGSGGDDEVD